MSDVCSNCIAVEATNSEWKEISTALKNGLIDWTGTMDGIVYNDRTQEIFCATKWSPTPWEDGYMSKLSQSYPSALFHYTAEVQEDNLRVLSTCFCNGNEKNKAGRKQAYKNEVGRFLSTAQRVSEGIDHRIEIMPDGRVASDGENRFGECDIFSWMNIKAISCGNWHTVGLKADGSVVACGSNVNGQCDVSELEDEAISISCGRYHTAILLKSGKVIVKGNLEPEAKNPKKPLVLTPADFPLIRYLTLSKDTSGWEKMNERIEHISAGDELTLKASSEFGGDGFEVLNVHGEKIGDVAIDGAKSLIKMLKDIKVTVDTVTPLSARRKGSKYAAMTIKLEYNMQEKGKNKAASVIGGYTQTRVESWPPVEKIISIFDAVIGVTATGEYFVDGFCPCSEEEIIEIVGRL